MTLFEVHHKIREETALWLDLQQKADELREKKADMFAIIADRQSGKTNAEKERQARLDPEWTEYRNGMLHAENLARRAKHRVKDRERYFDAMRSMGAMKRKDMDFGSLTA